MVRRRRVKSRNIRELKSASGVSYYLLLPRDVVKLSKINMDKAVARLKYLHVRKKEIIIAYVIREEV